MCANYTPVTRLERLKAYFGAGLPEPYPEETFPGSLAPFMRRAGADPAAARELQVGVFGLLPHWAKDVSFARNTYNARSETAPAKPSFRDAWQRSRRCIVPCDDFFEPRWEGGRAVRWRIVRHDRQPIGIAGLWDAWHAPDGARLLSFTMLTVNADAHPLMRQFHKPGDEKRMVAILDADRFDDWLDQPADTAQALLTCFPSEALHAEPAPLPRRVRAAAASPAEASAATLPLFDEFI